jgi:hypothetical protein
VTDPERETLAPVAFTGCSSLSALQLSGFLKRLDRYRRFREPAIEAWLLELEPAGATTPLPRADAIPLRRHG